MPMVSTGPISLGGNATSGGLNQSVNIELGRAANATINMNESAVRTLAGVPSGAISMNNFYGKSNRVAISFTYASNTQEANLNVAGIAGYVAGSSDITITVNSGVYLWSNNTGVSGLTLTNGTAGDTITLVNNGFIMGRGGDGGGRGPSPVAGGPALTISRPTTINNTNGSAYIGGGGGGGGRGVPPPGFTPTGASGGGGGAGGGGGGSGRSSVGGGAIGATGGSGAPSGSFGGGGGGGGAGGGGGSGQPRGDGAGGGGGGRIFPGAGGGGGAAPGGGPGGAGGSSNASGGNAGPVSAGGGGGWGASGGNGTGPGSTGGSGGGRAVTLNGNTVTWVSGNTTRVWGAVS